MRNFPFEDCPTAGDLVAYMSGDPLEPQLRDKIAAHVESCWMCQHAVKAANLDGVNAPERPIDALPDALIEAIQNGDRGSSRCGHPQPGEVWATDSSWRLAQFSDVYREAFCVLVLDTFPDPYSDDVLANVVPATDPNDLLSEWDLRIHDEWTDLGVAVDLRVGYGFVAATCHLVRRIGSLPNVVFDEVSEIIRGYFRNEHMGVPSFGVWGNAEVRRSTEWPGFRDELVRISRELGPTGNFAGGEEDGTDNPLPRQDTDGSSDAACAGTTKQEIVVPEWRRPRRTFSEPTTSFRSGDDPWHQCERRDRFAAGPRLTPSRIDPGSRAAAAIAATSRAEPPPAAVPSQRDAQNLLAFLAAESRMSPPHIASALEAPIALLACFSDYPDLVPASAREEIAARAHSKLGIAGERVLAKFDEPPPLALAASRQGAVGAGPATYEALLDRARLAPPIREIWGAFSE